MAHVTKLHKALLIMHSPTDDTVGIDNATHIFVAAKHPKSFVSLAGADHLLSEQARRRLCRRRHRRLGGALPRSRRSRKQAADLGEAPRTVVVRETRDGKFQQTVSIGPHQIAGRRAGRRRRRGHRARTL